MVNNVIDVIAEATHCPLFGQVMKTHVEQEKKCPVPVLGFWNRGVRTEKKHFDAKFMNSFKEELESYLDITQAGEEICEDEEPEAPKPKFIDFQKTVLTKKKFTVLQSSKAWNYGSDEQKTTKEMTPFDDVFSQAKQSCSTALATLFAPIGFSQADLDLGTFRLYLEIQPSVNNRDVELKELSHVGETKRGMFQCIRNIAEFAEDKADKSKTKTFEAQPVHAVFGVMKNKAEMVKMRAEGHGANLCADDDTAVFKNMFKEPSTSKGASSRFKGNVIAGDSVAFSMELEDADKLFATLTVSLSLECILF